MDSITHLALGAVIGEAVAGRTLGRKAMVLGAAAQFLPDLDFIAVMWLSPAENLAAHRGITHSIAFNILSALALAFTARRAFKGQAPPLKFWLMFFGIQAGVHIFIDTFNAYGVGLLEPFSAMRFSFHSIYVFDPLFLLFIFIAAAALIILRINSPLRRWWVVASLGACILYLATSITIKTMIQKEVKESLHTDKVVYNDFITTPTPFNVLLWYVIIRTDNGYYTGYRSVFDQTPTIPLSYISRNDQLVHTIQPSRPDEKLVTLSQGFYVYSSKHDTVSINLIGFGRIAGWKQGDAPFVLKCDLFPQETTLAPLQEGRSKEMNKESLSALINRIFNEKPMTD